MSAQEFATADEATAAVTMSILGEFAREQGDENAQRLLNQVRDEGAPAAEPAVVRAAAVAPPTTPDPVDAEPEETVDTTAPALPDFTPVLGDDLSALLEEPDFDQEAADEVAAEFDAGEIDENVDVDAARKLRALEKRNAFLEQRLVSSNRKQWVEENLKAYPLFQAYPKLEAKMRSLQATSRRDFARQAAALNAEYTELLAEPLGDINALRTNTRAEAKAEARREAAEQWGLPVAEPTGSGAANDPNAVRLARLREQRAPLEDRLKALAGIAPKGGQ